MISSATRFLLKRSGTPGRIPTLADLKLGELAVNYSDGRIFMRQENEVVGTRIIEPGQDYSVGRTFFVSENGNDNNSGLNDRDTLRTIKKAAELAQFGDGIKVYPGHYIEDNPITFRDLVAVEGMELRNVLVTPANPDKDLYLVGDGFHATNHSFVSNKDAIGGAAIISFRPLEGTASDRYFDAARLIRDNLDYLASEAVGFLTSGFSGFAGNHRAQDAARGLELNRKFIVEEAFQFINSPDYKGPSYVNPDINQCRSDLGNILDGWRYDLIADGNKETTGIGLTYYAPIPFVKSAQITDLVYDNTSGLCIIETDIDTQSKPGDRIKLKDITLDCPAYDNDFIISGFTYDNVSGIGTVTLPFLHDIQAGDNIKLKGLKFDCPPYGAESYFINNFVYDETTGESVISLNRDHNLNTGEIIELRDIQFDCPPYGGQFTNIINLEYNNLNGEAVVTFEDPTTINQGDRITLFDIRMTCPAYGNAISVADFDYDNFTGIAEVESLTPHGLEIDDFFKLEDLKFSCESYLNETFQVTNFVYNNLTGASVLTLDRPHSFVTGEEVRLADIVFSCNSYKPHASLVLDATYDNTTGVTTITVDAPVASGPDALQIGDQVRLEGLNFQCNGYSFTDIAVTDAFYEDATGFLTLTLQNDHNQDLGQFITLTDLLFSCGFGTEVYPTDPTVEYEILNIPSANQLIVNVGVSTIQHSYVSGGTATVGITTHIFPDGTQGYDFIVTDLVDPQTFVINAGVSTIAHTYLNGGEAFVGFTTTVFPDGTQGDLFTVNAVPASNEIHINVGVSSIPHTYVGGGTASSTDSFIPVSNFSYDNISGVGTLSLSSEHGLIVGDSFVLEDLKVACNQYRLTAPRIDITNFVYDNLSGIATINLANSHDLSGGDLFALYDINTSCFGGQGKLYPDGDPTNNFFEVLATPNPNTIITNVGVSSIVHTYVSGGELQVGITTNIYPDGTRPSGKFFNVISVPSPTEVVTNIGVSTIAHTYVSGGKFYTGITTNIFPQVFDNPNIYVIDGVYDNISGIVTITTEKPHGLNANDPVLLQYTEWECASGGPGGPGSLIFPRNNEIFNVATVLSPNQYSLNVGPSAFPHTYVEGGISTPQNITAASYDNLTGRLTVSTVRQNGYKKGDKASVIGLNFSCSQGNKIYPEPNDLFPVQSVNGSVLEFDVGPFPSIVHTYIGGGSISYQTQSVPIAVALYNEDTGILQVTLTAPITGLAANDVVRMQGLQFVCDSGVAIYPKQEVPFFPIVEIVDGNTYVLQLETSTFVHTYQGGGFSSLHKRPNDPNIFKVLSVPTPTTVITNVGVSSIPHDYVGGGNFFVGITTDIFPDGTRPDLSRFEVISRLSPNQVVVDVGVSTIPHFYESGGRAQYGETNERKVNAFAYNNLTGVSTVTVQGNHGLRVGDSVKLQGLEFECINSPGITTTIFPDGTAASFNIYPVTRIINNSVFETNVGPVAFPHTYLTGGSAFVGITTNIFPDGTQGFDYTVSRVLSSREVQVNVGISSIQHNYIRGGKLFAGRTNERDILDFAYDNITGRALLTLRQPESSLGTGDLIKLKDLRFDCPTGTGKIYPDSDDNLFVIVERLNPTQFTLEIGKSTIEHTYVKGTGAAFVGITTNIFPEEGVDQNIFPVLSIPSPNSVTARIGVSSIPHEYVGGGRLFTGITTNIFPGDKQNSPLGDTFDIDAVTTNNEIIINVGPSSIPHNYVKGGNVLYGESAGGELQHITGPGVKDATIAAIQFEEDMSKSVINNRPWGSFIAAETSLITEVQYDNISGFATVYAPNINAYRGDVVRMSDIQFKCSDEYAGLTTTFFPDNTRPEGQYFEVENRLGIGSFETFIGFSTIRHEYSRGGNVYRYRQNVNEVSYDNVTGLTNVRSIGHGFKVDDIVELGDLRFNCPIFNPDYDIENFQYNNLTGISTVTTTIDNDIEVGDLVKLDGIVMECPPYGNAIGIQSFIYDNTTGLSTVYTFEPHGINLNPRPSVAVATASYDNVSGILTVVTAQNINLDDNIKDGVILAGLAFTCAPTGNVEIYPDINGFVYSIEDVVDVNEFSINVGTSSTVHTFLGGGTATKVKRSDVKLQDLKFDCPAYGNDIDVTNFLYDNTSGNSLVSVAQPHGLKVGDTIKLADLKFQCPPYNNAFDVLSANYDNISGIVTISLNKALNTLSIGDKIRVKDLQFDCFPDPGVYEPTQYAIIAANWNPGVRRAVLDISKPAGAPFPFNIGDSIKITDMIVTSSGNPDFDYPDGRDPSLNIFRVLSATETPGNRFEFQVSFPLLNESNIIFGLNQQLNSYGNVTVGVTTNIFPENVGAEGGIYEVFNLPANNQVAINAGVSTIPHTYVRNGQVFTGVTTNFFPDPGNTQNSPLGNLFSVIDIPTPTQVRINVGVSTISHIYESGGSLLTGITTNIFPDGTQGDLFPVVGVAGTTELLLNVGVSSIPHFYEGDGVLFTGITTNIFPSTDPQNSPNGSIFEVLSKDDMCPDRFTVNVGPSTIPHVYVEGGTVTTGVTTDRFPDGTFGFEFPVLSVTDENNFVVNVGTSTITHEYIDGGFTRRIESPIRSFNYTNATGIATVGVTSHRLNQGDLVKLRDIKFDCDPYGNEKFITNAQYNNATGRFSVFTSSPHELVVSDIVKLSDIQMDCGNYGNTVGIVTAIYNRLNGELFVETLLNHGLSITDDVKVAGLQFSCNSGISTYPDGDDASLNIYPVDAILSPTSFIINVGVSTVNHTYEGGGDVFVGVTTNIFPGNAQNSPRGSFLRVIDTPAADEFVVDVGISTIAHGYIRGGIVQSGITTDIFPDGTQGDYFVVEQVLSDDLFVIDAGISSITHRYNSGGFASKYATYQSQFPQIIDDSVIRVSGDCPGVEDRIEQLAGIVTTIIDQGPQQAPGGSQYNVTQASYNKVNGELSLTLDTDIDLAVNDIVRVQDLLFECNRSTGITTAVYDNKTGLLTVTTDAEHQFTTGDAVRLEGLGFICTLGEKTYPEDSTRFYNVSLVISPFIYQVQLETSTLTHTYTGGGISDGGSGIKLYPKGNELYPIIRRLSDRTYVINVGTSSINHTYVSGGVVSAGLRYEVVDADFDTTTGVLTVETLQDNHFVKDTGVHLNNLQFSCAQGTKVYPDKTGTNVVDAQYNSRTGALRITTELPHQLYADARVTLSGLVFSCLQGTATYPFEPTQYRVVDIEDEYNYLLNVGSSTFTHTYVSGGFSDNGQGNFKVSGILSPTRFTIDLAPNSIVHTYEGGGTAASTFNEQITDGINLRTKKCADDVKKIYLAVAHDITRGGNWKCVEAAKRYYDALGQVQFISGGEIHQTVDTLDFSINIARCIINNVSWGYVTRGYLRSFEKSALRLPKSDRTSVVDFKVPREVGQFSTDKKFIKNFQYQNFTGIATVTTTLSHGFVKYASIKLDGIEFSCPGNSGITTTIFPDGTHGEIFEVIEVIDDNPEWRIDDVVYDNVTGILTATTRFANDLSVGTQVRLNGLNFRCGSLDVKVYPENPNYRYEVLDKPSPTEIVVNVGVSSIAHDYVNNLLGADPFVKEDPTKFTTHVGTIDFAHNYVGGGTAWNTPPFTPPIVFSQVRDISIQNDPIQLTNSSPCACDNVQTAIENCIGVVTSIIKNGFEDSGVVVSYPGNNGRGVPSPDLIPSQGVGNIIKGPYIRNCTNFVPKSIGMRMDGFDAEPGDEISNGVQGSSNVDSFTQFNPGGIGCSISNGTYQQLVSIFTICCDEAIVCDSGAQLDLTNSNSSFGTLGLVARGVGDATSKCIDRYTAVVASESQIEDDTVQIAGLGEKRPYDGQGIFFGELFREVVRIQVIDRGSGYSDANPPNAFVAEPTGPSGIKAEISPTVVNGEVVSIEIISNGNQYRTKAPVVTIDPPRAEDGRQARAIAITEPLYYDVDSATKPIEGVSSVVFKQRLNNTVSAGTTVYFSRLSLQIASSHSFEYIGAGNTIDGARPSQGGVPIKENEVVKVDGGSIVYTSTDQAGNFNIGDDFIINQFTGTVTGRSFDQSVLNKVTPLIIALDS